MNGNHRHLAIAASSCSKVGLLQRTARPQHCSYRRITLGRLSSASPKSGHVSNHFRSIGQRKVIPSASATSSRNYFYYGSKYSTTSFSTSTSLYTSPNNTAKRHLTTNTEGLELNDQSSIPPPGPILTFLSPNPAYSQSAIHFLNEMFQLPELRLENCSATLEKNVENSRLGNESKRDCLDELHFGSSNNASMKWDSQACRCPSSGTILHFLSLAKDGDTYDNGVGKIGEGLKLLSIHGSNATGDNSPTSTAQTMEENYNHALLDCRRRLANAMGEAQFFPSSRNDSDDRRPGNEPTSLASSIESRLRGVLFYIFDALGRQPTPSWILTKYPNPSLPTSTLMDLEPISYSPSPGIPETRSIEKKGFIEHNSSNDQTGEKLTYKLRELAIPFFPEFSTISSQLSRSDLLRPLPGLYQCNNHRDNSSQSQSSSSITQGIKNRNTTENPGLILRPLPAATEDLRLPPPSLIFQSLSLADAQHMVENKVGGRTAKIGWRGDGLCGSLMILHPSIVGLDVRVSEVQKRRNNSINDVQNLDEWVLSSSFDEAQESLLAGSLDDLQSAHVVSEGAADSNATATSKHCHSAEVDSKSGKGDCWVEVRSNVKQPIGFWKKVSRVSPFALLKGGRSSGGVKVAKPPDLPYE